ELKNLQGHRQKVEADMASANETLQQAQRSLGDAASQRKQVETKIGPLEQLVKEITDSQSAIKEQREANGKEIEDANKFQDELTIHINKQLSSARRKAIQAAIEKVDADIDGLQNKVQELKDQIAKADAAVTEAQKQTATPDQTLAQLRQLPAQVQ